MKELYVVTTSKQPSGKYNDSYPFLNAPISRFLQTNSNQNDNIECTSRNMVTDFYHAHLSNSIGLPTVYNNYINENYKDRILVFVHDDVDIKYTYNELKRQLNLAIQNEVDIIGVAGASKFEYRKPTLWHLMGYDQSGSVAHPIQYGGKRYKDIMLLHTSAFGYYPKQCMLLDGLFLAVNTSRLLEVNHKFDEQFTFHHYDLDFCIQADKKGLTMSTWDIPVIHYSPGLRSFNDPKFVESDKLFCKKYNIQ